MSIAPLLPLPWIVMLVVAALAVTVIWMRGKGRGGRWAMGMRVVAVLLLGAVLLNPMRREANSGDENAAPSVWLIVDDSGSMATVDEGERWNRLDRACQQLRPWAGVGRNWWIGSDVRPWEQDALGEGHLTSSQSRLIEGMRQLVGMAPAGTQMVLASDGHDMSIEGSDEQLWRQIGEQAMARNVRIDTWTIGGSDADIGRRQTRLSLSGSPTLAFVSERVTMTVVLERRGEKLNEQPVSVRLMRDGQALQEASLRWASGQTLTRVTFTDQPFNEEQSAEWHVYEAVTGETKSQPLLVCNRGRAVNVLMLVGEPTVSSRMMIDALRREPWVKLTVEQAITDKRVSVTRYHVDDSDSTGKVDSAEELMRYDAVITDGKTASLIDGSWIEGYSKVHQGGVTGIVAGDWAGVMSDATGESWARYRSRVYSAVMNAAAMGESIGGGSVRVWTEPVNVTQGERTTIWVGSKSAMIDARNWRVQAVNSDGEMQATTMARAGRDAMRMSGQLTPASAGLWRVQVRDSAGQIAAQTAVMVRAEDVERRDVTSWPDGMRAMAQASGGRVLANMNGWEPNQKPVRDTTTSQSHMQSVLLQWAVMCAAVLLLGVSWIVRRWSGER